MKVLNICSVSFILLSCLLSYYHQYQNESTTRTHSNYTIKPLPRVHWPDSLHQKHEIAQFLQQIVHNQTALILVDYPYLQKDDPIWNLNQLFNFLESSNHLLEYKSNWDCPVFEYYEPELPLTDVLRWKQPNNNSILAASSIKQYWTHIQSQNKRMHDYMKNESTDSLYACNVSNGFEFRSLSSPIDPTPFATDFNMFVPQSNELQIVKLWLGSKGIITKFHFDVSDNFNIQLYGKKLFRLIEPKYHWNMHHYPWIHPQSRKSQIAKHGMFDYTMRAAIGQNLFEGIVMYEAELSAGEILYIPPIWDHEVIGMDDEIININVWSDGIEASLQRKLTKYSLPFDRVQRDIDTEITKQKLMAINLQRYIKSLLIEYCREFGMNTKQWSCHDDAYAQFVMSRFVKSRYEPLFAESMPQNYGIKHLEKHETIMSEMRDLCKLLSDIQRNESSAVKDRWLDNKRFADWYEEFVVSTEAKYSRYARKLIAKELRKVHENVALIFLTSYFEIIAENVLDAYYVYPFFSFCF